ncbi:MAG: hypothetical protein ACK4QP_14155 [Pseudorhizobium sp.]
MTVHVEPGRVHIITRGGHDRTHRFSAIEAAAPDYMPTTMILNGGGGGPGRAAAFRLRTLAKFPWEHGRHAIYSGDLELDEEIRVLRSQ